jgi:hypothetical protein
MKFKYTAILIVRNMQTGDTDVVEAPAHRVPVGALVTYGTSFVGKVISAHWVGGNDDADSSYAMAKTLAPHIYTITGYAHLHEVTPDEDT